MFAVQFAWSSYVALLPPHSPNIDPIKEVWITEAATGPHTMTLYGRSEKASPYVRRSPPPVTSHVRISALHTTMYQECGKGFFVWNYLDFYYFNCPFIKYFLFISVRKDISMILTNINMVHFQTEKGYKNKTNSNLYLLGLIGMRESVRSRS